MPRTILNSMFQTQMLKRLAQGAKRLGAMLQVKLGRPATGLISRLVGTLGRRVNLGLIKVIITFLARLHRLQKRNGLTYMVKTMKSLSTTLMQVSGGERLKDLSPLGPRFSRTRGGLPRIIPALHRANIRSGDTWTVRLWLTLFGLYRVIEIPGVLKIRTITDPCMMDPSVIPSFSKYVTTRFRAALLKNFAKGSKEFPAPDFVKAWYPKNGPQWYLGKLTAKPFLMAKTGPAASKDSLESARVQYSPVSSSPAGIVGAAILWTKSPLFPLFEAWCKMTKNIWVLNRLESWANAKLNLASDFVPQGMEKLAKKQPTHVTLELRTLGRLGTSDEPAGKVRVFAMVDIFTQWLFDPLHQGIFELLRRIPQDGTFDQLKPIENLMKKVPNGPYFSFDLSAATDRLPLALQKVLLSPVLGAWGAEVWGCLLVGRPYEILHKGALHLPDIGKGDLREVYYSTGQPMGALSSWAMLALTHHAIVQWSAVKAGVIAEGGATWFEDYALLGDDIVIANSEVARCYKYLMNDCIAVTIQDFKSLRSENPNHVALEFAKRFFLNGKDATPIPFAEFWAMLGNLPASLEFARKHRLTLAQYLSALGYGYKAKGSVSARLITLPERLRNYILAFNSPAGPAESSLQLFLTLKSIGDVYVWNDAKLRSLITDFIQTEKDTLLEKLNQLDPLLKWVQKMITVSRDQYHYSMKEPRPAERLPELEGIVGWSADNLSGHALDSIIETVYRPQFMDLPGKVRDLRNLLEEMQPTTFDWRDLESIFSLYSNIVEELDLLPSREIYRRLSTDKVDLQLHFSWTKVWTRYSRHLRSTRSSLKLESRSNGDVEASNQTMDGMDRSCSKE